MSRRFLAFVLCCAAPVAASCAEMRATGAELTVSLAGEPTVLVQQFSASPPAWEWGLGFAGFWARLGFSIPLADRLQLHAAAGVGFWALEAQAGVGVVLVAAEKGPGVELRLAGIGIAYDPLFLGKVYLAAGGQVAAVVSFPLAATVDLSAALGVRYTHYLDFDRFLGVPVELGLIFHPGNRRSRPRRR